MYRCMRIAQIHSFKNVDIESAIYILCARVHVNHFHPGEGPAARFLLILRETKVEGSSAVVEVTTNFSPACATKQQQIGSSRI